MVAPADVLARALSVDCLGGTESLCRPRTLSTGGLESISSFGRNSLDGSRLLIPASVSGVASGCPDDVVRCESARETLAKSESDRDS